MSVSFQCTRSPRMRARIAVTDCSNSATFTGCRPIVRRAESPRPMPMIIRPPERSCSVAKALAVTVGSRVPGLVTFRPRWIFEVASADIVRSG